MKICRAQLNEVENRISTLVKENDELSEKSGIEQS
jgi:exonuclease VII small subunit